MASKSQLNQMSKKQILQSLAYQQQQDSATMNRMLVAVARTVGVDPVQLAKNFVDQEENRKFAETLNSALDQEYSKVQESPAPLGDSEDSLNQTGEEVADSNQTSDE